MGYYHKIEIKNGVVIRRIRQEKILYPLIKSDDSVIIQHDDNSWNYIRSIIPGFKTDDIIITKKNIWQDNNVEYFWKSLY